MRLTWRPDTAHAGLATCYLRRPLLYHRLHPGGYSIHFNSTLPTVVDDRSFSDVTRNPETRFARPIRCALQLNFHSFWTCSIINLLQDQSSISDATLHFGITCLTFHSALTADKFRNSGICEFVHLHIIRSPGIQAVLDDFPLRR